MKKRLLSTLLVLCMVLALLPLTVQAADVNYAVIGGNLQFDAATGTITHCDEDVTRAVIPSEIYGVPVTSIADRAFYSCQSLTGVTIPNSVTSIGAEAFMGCSSLTSVTIPDSVTSIGDSAFSWCTGLTKVTIPDSITAIERGTFEYCVKLTSVTIPDSVTKLGVGAFNNCTSLTGMTIPEGVASIEWLTFQNCTNMTSVTIPSSVTYIDHHAFYGCHNLTDAYFGGSVLDWAEVYVGDGNPLPVTAIHFSSDTPGTATAVAYPSIQTVDIDGKKVEFQMYALRNANGNPTNYVKVRDLALALNDTAAQFSVNWNGTVNLVTGASYTPNGSENSTPFSGARAYKTPASSTNINGTAIVLQAIVLTDDNGGGYTYYQLRDLGRKLDFNVSWSAEKGVFIETNKHYSG